MSDIVIHKIIRSRRRSIGLRITKDAQLIVRAPYFVANHQIHEIVRRKGPWIKAKQDHFQRIQNQIKSRTFLPGEEFLFLGQSYPLVIDENLPKAVVLDGTTTTALKISRMVLGRAREHLECWYKTRALEHMTRRVEHYAGLAGLSYRSIKVNGAATRWGSCGYKDTLNFTWKLIMAPERVVDYVVIHELMHLKQKNHSSKFWAEVARMWPDYLQDELWLKKNGHLLHW